MVRTSITQREIVMPHTLEQFATACHRILKADPGPAGRQQVCTLLQEVLQDEQFVATHLGDMD